ncbi:MAG TPA: TetR/AcrR family transcriptional regulator [Anaerolineales bacterium]
MPRPFTEHEKDLIRTRLLQQGDRLFSAHGLQKTNVEELTRAAGISKGAFYKFYESKEALFLDITEAAERRVREEVLAVLDLPGPSPRARLLAALRKAFDLFEHLPLLQFLTGADYERVFSTVSQSQLQEHLDADRRFMEQFLARSRTAGIPIRVDAMQITSLLYPLALAILHREDLGPQAFRGNVDLLLELVAAYCVGEIRPGKPARRRPARKDVRHELAR